MTALECKECELYRTMWQELVSACEALRHEIANARGIINMQKDVHEMEVLRLQSALDFALSKLPPESINATHTKAIALGDAVMPDAATMPGMPDRYLHRPGDQFTDYSEDDEIWGCGGASVSCVKDLAKGGSDE